MLEKLAQFLLGKLQMSHKELKVSHLLFYLLRINFKKYFNSVNKTNYGLLWVLRVS